jgi:hypothetical protein
VPGRAYAGSVGKRPPRSLPYGAQGQGAARSGTGRTRGENRALARFGRATSGKHRLHGGHEALRARNTGVAVHRLERGTGVAVRVGAVPRCALRASARTEEDEAFRACRRSAARRRPSNQRERPLASAPGSRGPVGGVMQSRDGHFSAASETRSVGGCVTRGRAPKPRARFTVNVEVPQLMTSSSVTTPSSKPRMSASQPSTRFSDVPC